MPKAVPRAVDVAAERVRGRTTASISTRQPEVVALAKQLHATDPSRTEADRADPQAWEKYLPVARERLRPRAVGPPVQWRRRAHLRR